MRPMESAFSTSALNEKQNLIGGHKGEADAQCTWIYSLEYIMYACRHKHHNFRGRRNLKKTFGTVLELLNDMTKGIEKVEHSASYVWNEHCHLRIRSHYPS